MRCVLVLAAAAADVPCPGAAPAEAVHAEAVAWGCGSPRRLHDQPHVTSAMEAHWAVGVPWGDPEMKTRQKDHQTPDG